ncbi:MAG: peptidylprolyl isomerase [Planctomycetota bacterium]
MTQFRALVSAGCVLFVLALTFVSTAYSQDKKAPDSAIAEIDKFISSKKIDKSSPRWRLGLSKPPKADFGKGDTDYFWNIETNKGPMKVKLWSDVAPMHVSSTIYLTRLGFYDTLPFHRVITGFMAQGGCPIGTGTGSPGFKYSGEFSSSVKHDRPGLLSMANSGPGTDGSQFFLTFKATPWLNNRHTLFGEVVEGLKVLKVLEALGSRTGKTAEALFMKKCTITTEIIVREEFSFAAIDKFIAAGKVNKSVLNWRKKLRKPPKYVFPKGKSLFWNMETNKGKIRIRFIPEVAPMHVSSAIYLTRLGYYDGLIFHRVIQGFMAQGGCPAGTGEDGPGYQFGGEFSKDVKHDSAGVLSTANAGPGTDGSQFFITFGPTPSLDGSYTIYGKVVEGLDVVQALEKAGSPDASGKTSEKLKITKCTVTEK